MRPDLNNANIKENIFSAEFGLEKECLRVDENGFLSHTKHPFEDHCAIQRDFCENQVEFVTGVFESSKEVCEDLRNLHKYSTKRLNVLKSGKEFLWPFSNPPYVRGEDDIPVAVFDGAMMGKGVYRQYLAEKYGKMKMLFSGIHLNFSFSDKLLNLFFEDVSNQSFTEFKNSLYLQLAKKLVNYSWLIVYLTASSPIMDGSFFDKKNLGIDIITGYSSSRCSEIGYWNKFIPILSYENLESYVSSINEYIDCNLLRSVSELYYPIRLKPKGENSLENLIKKGVNHIELRMIDVNPLSPIGIFEEDIDFIHLLIVYLTFQDDFEFNSDMQINAINNEKMSAHYDDEKIIKVNNFSASLRTHALNMVLKLENFFKDYDNAEIILSHQKQKIVNSEFRYSSIIKSEYGKNYVQNGLNLAKKYTDFFIKGGG